MKGKTRFFSFLIVAIMLFVGTALPAAAGPGLGNAPIVAHPMSSGLNVGTMAPGESVWYAMEEGTFGLPDAGVILNLVYKPGDHNVSPYVNFQVFAGNQVDRYLQGYTDSYAGMGVYTTTDFDDETAERLWSGSLPQGQASYVRLFNNSNQAVEYHLMALTQEGVAPASQVQAMSQVVETAEVSDTPRAFAPVAAAGAVPAAAPAMPAVPAAADVSANQMAPAVMNAQPVATTMASLQWQMVAAAVQNMSAADAAAWLQMASQMGWLPSIGVPATLSPSYAVPQVTAAGFSSFAPAITTAGVVAAPQAAPAAAPVAAQLAAQPSMLDMYPNVYPVRPLLLHDGANVGKLAPGGEHWFTFMRKDLNSKPIAHMCITMFVTPTDGNTVHLINFQLFTGSQLQIWQRGTPQSMTSMGEGELVSRDNDDVTGERLWAGDLVNGDTYYLRVVNGSENLVDYYVITNDVTNTELGDKVFAANPGIFNPLMAPAQ